MNKYILILFLLTIQLIASNEIKIKAKARQVDNHIKAKILISGNFINPENTKRSSGDKNRNYFIQRITADINNSIVYDIVLSHVIGSGYNRNLFLTFNFLYEGRGDILNFVVTDNKDKKSKYSTKIKNSLGKNAILHSKTEAFIPMDYGKENPKLWKLTNTQEAMKEFCGTDKGEPNIISILIKKPNPYSKAYYRSISINSKIKMKSIAIFSDDLLHTTKTDKYPSIRAVISSAEDTTISDLAILTLGKCCEDEYIPISVIGIDRKGTIYKTQIDARLLCSADCEM